MSETAARLAALALIAVTAAAASVAGRGDRHGSSLPQPVGGWRTAVVAVRASAGDDACGIRFGGATAGLRSAGLPCGVKLYARLGRRVVLTQVVDHGRPARGAGFDATPALARLLGLRGRARVAWSFVR